MKRGPTSVERRQGGSGDEVVVAGADDASIVWRDQHIHLLQEGLKEEAQQAKLYHAELDALRQKEETWKPFMQQRIQALEEELLQLKGQENPLPGARQTSSKSQVQRLTPPSIV